MCLQSGRQSIEHVNLHALAPVLNVIDGRPRQTHLRRELLLCEAALQTCRPDVLAQQNVEPIGRVHVLTSPASTLFARSAVLTASQCCGE